MDTKENTEGIAQITEALLKQGEAIKVIDKRTKKIELTVYLMSLAGQGDCDRINQLEDRVSALEAQLTEDGLDDGRRDAFRND